MDERFERLLGDLAAMIVISLQSGSNGNCIYVEHGDTRLIFDAGISGKRAEERLAALGRDIRSCHGLLISHDHGDHIGCAGVFHRKFGLPVYVTAATFEAARRRRLGKFSDIRYFRSGDDLIIGDITVHTVPTPHDGADGTAFVAEADGRRVGILTDLGHVFDTLPGVVGTLDAVVIESNYDPDMLASGPYPPHLQDRIRSHGGHLSNDEAAELLLHSAAPNLQWACLSHLSENNNTPALALRAHRQVLPDHVRLLTASRHEAVLLPELA
jgi:phosphoribosyl 1,2-cyclic phosphodiesterase